MLKPKLLILHKMRLFVSVMVYLQHFLHLSSGMEKCQKLVKQTG